jgi:hypothetical protein
LGLLELAFEPALVLVGLLKLFCQALPLLAGLPKLGGQPAVVLIFPPQLFFQPIAVRRIALDLEAAPVAGRLREELGLALDLILAFRQGSLGLGFGHPWLRGRRPGRRRGRLAGPASPPVKRSPAVTVSMGRQANRGMGEPLRRMAMAFVPPG